MSDEVSESDSLRTHWLERLSAVQSLLEEGKEQEAAATLSDVTELPADPEIRILSAEVYGLLNPSAGLEIIDGILAHSPENESALRVREDIQERLSGASESERSKWVRILTPGEQKRRKQELENRILAAALGLGVSIALFTLLALVATPSPPVEPPKIMVIAPPELPDNDLPEEQLRKIEKVQVPSAPKAGEMSSKLITAASISSIASVSVDSIGTGLGMADMGNSFGASMNFGVQGGASAMFFGSKSEGDRFLFVLDASRSMRPDQVKLRDEELQRALNGIRGAQYQVLLFAGGAYFAERGWGLDPANTGGSHGPTHFVSPNGKYEFSSESVHNFNLKGPDSDFTPAPWKRANSVNIRKSVEIVRRSKLFTGTDWDMALEMAHMMDPPPDVIFFMSDGLDSELSVSDILRTSRRKGRPKINVVAMQTDQGALGFAGIAEGSKGTYTIVNLDGEVLDGFDNPRL
ncbi:MAG: hypothetical protein AAF733_12740 [Verrucomicrobiota bacterium]